MNAADSLEAARHQVASTRPDLVFPDVEPVGLVEGRLEMPIEGLFPLSQAAEMHRRLEGRGVAGKPLLKAAG